LLAAGLVAVALVAAACGSSSKKSTSSGGGGNANGSFTPVGTKVAGGTVTWAEGPGAQPTYIFPLYTAQECSVANGSQFQPLMYRSLYWYGNDQKASIDYDYSIGNQPTFSADGKTVTITLKSNYKWSDGEPVDARDVVLWMNLLKANKTDWCVYVPNLFPDNVVSYTATGPYTVQFVMDKAYNPTWLVYNEFSQITPLPLAWDTTTHSLGPTADNGHLPDTTTAGAMAVYKNLDGLAKDTSSYTTSPIWGVVDGPFKLVNFTTTGEADFVPNPDYGGPVKAQISEFKELPYTAEQAELNVLRTGPSALTIGYLPNANLPLLPSIKALGFHTLAAYTFSADYWPLNLNNPKFGPVFRQVYFRQAFQHLVDQKGWINAFESFGGTAYSIPQYGLVPTTPANNFLAPDANTDPAPFSTSAASQLLSSHGWKVVPNGTTTCVNPGTGPNQCGAGVPAGLGLSFNLDYQSGVAFLDSEMKTLKSDASQVGIQLQLTTHPFDQVISTAIQCAPTDSTCKWTSENWGGGWVYSPDYYPTGESVVETHAAADYSNYSDPHMDALIAATTTATAATAQSTLNAYQDYVRQQLPFVFEPNTAGNPVPGGPTIVSEHLGGFSINAYTYITPEDYYLTK
jgi:peptide/nickel transport system substrate-binding protein